MNSGNQTEVEGLVHTQQAIYLGLYPSPKHKMRVWRDVSIVKRAVAVPPEDPGSNPSTYMVAHNCL